MSDWDNKGSISMSFDIKADEKAVDFFNRTMKELKDFEKAINERMIQLFDENIGVGGARTSSDQTASASKSTIKCWRIPVRTSSTTHDKERNITSDLFPHPSYIKKVKPFNTNRKWLK